MESPPMVLVVWDDASSQPGWVGLEEAVARGLTPTKITTLGFLIAEDADRYLLSPHLGGPVGETPGVGDVMTILKATVTSVNNLTAAKRRRA